MKRFLSLALVAFLFAAPTASRAAEFLRDTFTGTNGTNLNAHTADSGAIWVGVSQSGDNPQENNGGQLTSNRLAGMGNQWGANMRAVVVPPTAEYNVTFDIRVVSLTGYATVTGRFLNGAGYEVSIRQGQLGFGHRFATGNYLGYGDTSYQWAVGQTYTVRLEIKNAFKNVYVNGVLKSSFISNDITAAGSVAVNIGGGTTQTGFQIDSIVASSVEGGAPASLTAQDIGSVAYAGSTLQYEDGVYNVAGSGADIWETADAFHFAHKSVSTESSITAQVLAVENTHTWAKAGVMIRDTVQPGSTFAGVFLTPGNGVTFHWRSGTSNSTNHTTIYNLVAPRWVRLVRNGNVFSGFYSSDGTTWITIQSVSLSMGSNAEAGLALTSHNNGVLGHASFDSLTIVGGVAPIPVVTGLTASTGTVGVAFSSSIQASNNPFDHEVVSGSLPPGLSLNAGSGLISGTPTGGSGTFSVTAKNAAGTSAPVPFTITINPAPPPVPVVSGLTVTTGTTGASFTSNIQASNNPQSYAVVSGSLPAGLTLNTSTGVISGIPEGGNGPGSFGVTATNAGGTSSIASFTITINPAPPVVSGLTVTTGTVGVAFSSNIQASNTPQSYALVSGSLPPGLTLNTSTGVISGTPTGGSGTFGVTATNAGGASPASSFTITIGAAPLGALLGGTIIGTAPWHGMSEYDKDKAFDGNTNTIFDSEAAFIYIGRDLGSAHTINRIRYFPRTSFNARMLGGRFRVANLPDLSDAVTVHTISSIPPEGVWQEVILEPAVTGYRYAFYTTDAAGHGNLAELAFYGTAAPVSAPEIIGLTATTGTVGTPFSSTIQASNSPQSYAVVSGGLPAGLSLNTTTGVISGTPGGGGGTFGVTATNAGGTSSVGSFTITINPPPPVVSGLTVTTGTVGVAFSSNIQASNTPQSYAVASGALPAGLTLNTGTGVISGTPTGGSGTFSVTATNAGGTSTAVPFTIMIGAASGGPGSYSYFRFDFNATGGNITQLAELVLRGANAAPLSPVSYTARGENGVQEGLAKLFDGQVGTKWLDASNTTWVRIVLGAPALLESYSLTSANDEPQRDPGSWTLSGSNDGSTWTVIDTRSGQAWSSRFLTREFSVPSTPAIPAVTGLTATSGTVGTPLTASIQASNSPQSYGLASGSLPPGLTLNTSTGVISGTPTGGNGTFSVTATNTSGTSPAVPFTITINPASGGALLSGTIIGSAPWHGLEQGDKFKAFDGDTATAFDSETAFIYVGLDLGSAHTVNRIRYHPRNRLAFRMNGGRFRVANLPDLSDAVTIYTITFNPPESTWQDVTLSAPISGYRYVFFTTDAGGYGNVGELEFFGSASVAAPVVSGLTALTGTVGTPFTSSIQASQSPQSYAVASGSLPAGLSLNTSTGVISGTPTGGSGNFGVTATNAGGTSGIVTFTITINPAAPVVSGLTATTGTVGTPFSATIQASNSPQSFALASGALPPGLSLNATSGVISGTPTGGNGSFSVTATNAGGTSTAAPFTITVSAAPPSAPVISGLTATSGTVGAFFTATIQASNSPQSYALASGSFPAGLSLNTTTGVISGTPTGGNGTFTVTATNSGGTSVGAPFTITIGAAPDTQPPSVPTGLGRNTVTATSFTLTWSQPPDNVLTTRYKVKRDDVELPEITATSLAITGLTQGTAYSMQVSAGDAAGNWSAYSAPFEVVTTDTQVPTVPTGLTSSEVATYSFTLSWTASTDNRPGIVYEVYRNGSYLDTTSATTMSISGLAPSTAYQMTVLAVDAANNRSAQSIMHEVTTAPLPPPTLLILGGDGQETLKSQFNAQPFDILVLDSTATQPLTGVSVTFAVQSGGGLLALTNTGSPVLYSNLIVTTDQDGTVQVYYQQPSTPGVTSQIRVHSGLTELTLFSTSAGSVSDTDGNGLPDAWERRYFTSPGVDPNGDPDGDGMVTRDEMNAGRNPMERLDAFALPPNVQLVLPTPGDAFFGIRTSDWAIMPVATP
jgi:chitodextrinase